MPDYGSEESDSEEDGEEEEAMSSSSGSSMTSMVQSPQVQSQNEGAYRMEDIDRIIREAKEQKKQLLHQKNNVSSSLSNSEGVDSELSESFDDKYLKKYSAISQN